MIIRIIININYFKKSFTFKKSIFTLKSKKPNGASRRMKKIPHSDVYEPPYK